MLNLSYDVVRKNRENNGRNGGGVCIYVQSNMNFQICAELSPSNIELMMRLWDYETPIQAIPSTCYRPPLSSPDLSTVYPRSTVIDKIDAENLELYLLGDLNCNLLPDIVDNNSSRLLNIMDIFGVTQLITEPT